VLAGAFRHAALARFTPLQSLSTAGGEGVYLAREGRELVVVRVLVDADAPLPGDVAEALRREVKPVAGLDHESIARVRELILESSVAALVSDLTPGISLQRLLRFASARGVRLPDDVGWYVVERVLSALVHAHAAKDDKGATAPVLHRSLGASSVVVGWDGSVKVDGFNDARIRSVLSSVVKAPASDHAAPSSILAPEQARGGDATTRTDVFLLALLAVRVATGRTPYARHRHSAAEQLLAMSEAEVMPLARTRPELIQGVRSAVDRSLAIDPGKRNVTALDLAVALRAAFDLEVGRESLVKLLERWRDRLETSMSPWERRASIHDGLPESGDGEGGEAGDEATLGLDVVPEGTLALATPDDRPSGDPLVRGEDVPDEPWKKDALPRDEMALAPTDALTSASRVGTVAPDALDVPLPAMRMTLPSLPVHDAGLGPVAPPIAERVRSGRWAAAGILVLFVVLAAGGFMVLRSLMSAP